MVDTSACKPVVAAAQAPGLPGCGQLRSEHGARLPLRKCEVGTHIVGLTSTSTVTQSFCNPTDQTLEVSYIFPLPARSGVTSFEATLGGRKVIGRLEERSKARLDYERAIAEGHRAAIAQEDRAEVFCTRVGNLLPGEVAVVGLTLTGPLAFEAGEATFRFPLVVAPRYTSGRPVEGDPTGPGTAFDTDVVPDASRLSPPLLGPGDERPELRFAVRTDAAGLPVDNGPPARGPLRFGLFPGALRARHAGPPDRRLFAPLRRTVPVHGLRRREPRGHGQHIAGGGRPACRIPVGMGARGELFASARHFRRSGRAGSSAPEHQCSHGLSPRRARGRPTG